jgi:hypothetical protein
VLGGEDLGELVLAGVQQLAEGEHHLLAPGDRALPPLGEGLRGRGHGRVDIGG